MITELRKVVCMRLLAALAGGLAVSAATWDEGASFEERYRESAKLGRRLSSDKVETLCALLERLPAQASASVGEMAALKNNAADALLQQEALPPGLFPLFRRIFADPRQGEVWREYVVQKLPDLCLRLEGEAQRDVLTFLCERTTRR